MIDLGTVKPGATIRIPFSSFDKDDGSSITMTNYAVADILVYKDGSTTERASTSGYTATTDFDTKTGKHLAIIDLSDNTTAGFFAAGSEYIVAIDAVTVDAVTTGGWIARFRIGYPNALLDTTLSGVSSQTEVTLTAGPAENDALNGLWAIVHDVASSVQSAIVLVSDYVGATKTVTFAAAPTFTIASTDNISIMGLAPLQPTTLGNKLDVTATGAAGIDWGNIENQGSSINLSSTTTNTVNTASALTTNNDKTGYSISGTKTTLDALNDVSTAQVNTEVDTALADIGLDHLISSALPTSWATDVAAGSVFDNIADDGTAVYDRTTDSLQAVRDRGDAAWITGGGGGLTQAINPILAVPPTIDLANTASVRIGIILTNTLDDLPTTAEITPGTITIARKAQGGTSWSNVVAAAAMSEQDGFVYYDEVFDSGSGYAVGDMIRIQFESVSVTADANTYNITGATGVYVYSYIIEPMRGTDSAATASALATAQADLDTITGANGATLATTQGAISWGAQTISVSGATANMTFAGTGTGDVFAYTRGGTGALFDTAYATDFQANVNAAADLALSDYDPPTNAEMAAEFTTIKGPTWDSNDTLESIKQTALNTNGVATSAYSEASSANSKLGTVSDLGSGASIAANLVDIESQTDDIGAAGAGLTAIPWNAAWDAEVQSECADALTAYDPPTKAEVDALLTTQLTESYAANGVAPTLAQAVMAIHQVLMDFAISGTSLTVKQLDSTTTAFVITLNDGTSPTGATR